MTDREIITTGDIRNMPERIWAVPEHNCTVYMSGNSPITAQTGPFTHRRHGEASAYLREDGPTFTALVETLRLSRAALGEAMQHGTIMDSEGRMNRCGHAIAEADAALRQVTGEGG